MRRSLLILLLAGCAAAEDVTTGVVRHDSGSGDSAEGADTNADAPATDSGVDSKATDSRVDSGLGETSAPDALVDDTPLLDSFVADTVIDDTLVADTVVADSGSDTGATDADAGPGLGTVLIFDDTSATLAGAATTALGGTPKITAGGPAFNTLFDAKGIDIIVIDCSLNPLPAGVQTRVISWATGGGRLVFAYWDLDAELLVRSALQISSTVSLTAFKPVYADPASSVNLFAGVPSPQTKTGLAELVDNGDSLTVLAPAFLAARHDSTSGAGAIAVTRAGKVVVNGFSPYNIRTNDLDADGKKDMQEIYENELLYVKSK